MIMPAPLFTVMSALAMGTRFLGSALCTTIAPLSHNGLRWEKYEASATRMVNSAASQSTIFFFFVISTPNRNILRCLLHPATAGASHSSKVVHLSPPDAFADPDIG